MGLSLQSARDAISPLSGMDKDLNDDSILELEMTFQAYMDNIKAKTGLTPEGFRKAAQASGLLQSGPTATQFVQWLATEYDLGRGHAMAIYKVFKDKGWLQGKKAKTKTKTKTKSKA